jgi:lipopolysaccharide/colanic/teichoic acid biosynthesis glycosyltransferase
MDIIISIIVLTLLGWLIILSIIIAWIDTRISGIYKQERIGRYGKKFKVLKIRSMRNVKGIDTSVTTKNDPRITKSGVFFRKTKIDELPQFLNVLTGDMSIVGPRPDVSGFADELKGDDQIILTIRPGITGPASIYFRNEEVLLSEQKDPEHYNQHVIWPKKVELNKNYIKEWSVSKDLYYISKTIFS